MQKGSGRQGSRFWKLQGAGNDLLVLESSQMPTRGKAAFVKAISHRQLGVGCDQLMEVTSRSPLAIQIWNGNGSKSEMCANGARTFLFFAAHEKWIDPEAKTVVLQVSGKPYEGRRIGHEIYEFSLGEPQIGPLETLKVGEENIPFRAVITGNPHAVIVAHGPKSWKAPRGFDYKVTGPKIETHKRFPQKTNVEFLRKIQVKGKTAEVGVEVWERGAGATLSCGSGAVAVAAVVKALYPQIVVCKVRMTSFELRIRFEGAVAFISGPCALVAEGFYLPPGLVGARE
jgi:diaminopimelate epimerase